MTYRIAHLDKQHNVAEFGCGKAPLDEYIRRYASQDVRRNLARAFIASPKDDATIVAGYFTLSAGSVHCSDLPARLAKKLPQYPIPVAMMGRLAVDTRFKGRGLGSILLAKASQMVVQTSEVLAMAGIVVDPKDDEAVRFYRHFGFLDLEGAARRMFLPGVSGQAIVSTSKQGGGRLRASRRVEGSVKSLFLLKE